MVRSLFPGSGAGRPPLNGGGLPTSRLHVRSHEGYDPSPHHSPAGRLVGGLAAKFVLGHTEVLASPSHPQAWLVIEPGIAHPAKDYGMRGGHSLRLSARHSQRRAFDIGFAVKLTALLSALRSALHFATPCASCAMPVLSALPPHLRCLAALEQRLPTVVRFARSAPALNGCIAFSAFRECRPFSTQDPRRSQCR